MEFGSQKIIFVFVRPKYPGNIGSIARVIKNFGFKDLVLINPQCDVNSEEARKLAVHAKDVLRNARIYSSIKDAIDKERINYVVGTTARLGGDKTPMRNAITSDMIRNLKLPLDSTTAILLGSEDTGLTNEELEYSDLVVTIPTSEEYPVMNVSHAAAIIAYEFSLLLKVGRTLPYRAADRKEKEILLKYLLGLAKIVFKDYPEAKLKIQQQIITNWINRTFLTGREVHSLIGFVRRLIALSQCLDSKYGDVTS